MTSEEKMNKIHQEAEKLRMTNWEDLTAEQQLERMRNIVKSLQQTIQSNNRVIDKLNRGFEKHSHSNGKIVVDYDKYGGGSSISGCVQKSAQNFF